MDQSFHLILSRGNAKARYGSAKTSKVRDMTSQAGERELQRVVQNTVKHTMNSSKMFTEKMDDVITGK